MFTPPTSNPPATHNLANILFIHHSVGEGLVVDGQMRTTITTYNTAHSKSFTFWDHGYNAEGLSNPPASTGNDYDIPNDNTDPSGYDLLWTGPDPTPCMPEPDHGNHQVIAFKSCFPASAIPTRPRSTSTRTTTCSMRSFFDARTDHRSYVISQPPMHRLDFNDATEADNARALPPGWRAPRTLRPPERGLLRPVRRARKPEQRPSNANMLRYDYEGDHSNSDSHPNAAADLVVAPALTNFICQQASAY